MAYGDMHTFPPASVKQRTSIEVLQSAADVTSHRDRSMLARALVNTLAELIHSDRIAMYSLHPGEREKRASLIAESISVAGHACPPAEVDIDVSCREDFAAVLASGSKSSKPYEGQSILAVYPIISQDAIVGFLEVISGMQSDQDCLLSEAFLKVYSNYLSILDESETDMLTGLLNRRTFDKNMEKLIANFSGDDDSKGNARRHPVRRKQSEGLPHWLAMIDVDHFKRINDQFGHLYGDEVLLLLSHIMRRIFRQHDKLFRFGGEEFVVVLDRTTLENAKSVLERFRRTVEQYDFPQVGMVTVSIGLVRFDKPDVSTSIVGRADQALYYAKQNGRNQVHFYEDLIAAGKLSGEHFSNDVQMF